VQRAGDSIGITQAANGMTPAAGDIFIKVPYVYMGNSGQGCPTRQPWFNDPCVVFLAESRAGALRRFWSEVDDVDGKYSQTLLGMGPGWPGSHYFFSGSYTTPSGNSNILMAGLVMDGIRNPALLVHLPPFRINRTKNNFLINGPSSANASIKVPAAAGATHARIRFGFDPTNFYCSSRSEACVTDAVMNTAWNPYAYIGETLTPYTCSGGCSIPLPVDLGRAFYYRIEWLANGNVMKQSGPKPIVVN